MTEKKTKIYNNKIIKDEKFNEINLDDIIFKWGKIDISNFDNSSISNSDIGEGLIENSNFINSNLKKVRNFHGKFLKCNFKNLVLEEYDGRDNIFNECIFNDIIFKKSILRGSKFTSCFFKNCNFTIEMILKLADKYNVVIGPDNSIKYQADQRIDQYRHHPRITFL